MGIDPLAAPRRPEVRAIEEGQHLPLQIGV
jgi:hypothetical protein